MSESPIKPIVPKPAEDGSPVPPKISPMPFASAPKLNPVVRNAESKEPVANAAPPATPAAPTQPKAAVPPQPLSPRPAASSPLSTVDGTAPAPKPQPAPGKPLSANKTIILKRPVIRKPVFGAKPPSIKPATIKPVAAPVQPAASSPSSTITGPIPPTAVLRKTGIIADDSSPELQQAAKSKTSRISLNDAIGIAPTKSPAPLKTIRLKRPANLPSGSPLAPQPSQTPPPTLSDAKTKSPVAFKPLSPLKPLAPQSSEPKKDEAPKGVSITQKKTLKIQRPVAPFKRPVSLSKPAVKTPAPVLNIKPVENAPAPESQDAEVPEISAVATPAVKPVEPQPAPVRKIKPVPNWFMAISLITSIAALFVAAFLTYVLGDEGISKEPSANVTGFMQSEEEHLPAMPNLLIKWAQPN